MRLVYYIHELYKKMYFTIGDALWCSQFKSSNCFHSTEQICQGLDNSYQWEEKKACIYLHT